MQRDEASSPTPQEPTNYEFSSVENETIGGIGKWSKTLAILLFIEGGFALLNGDVVEFACSLFIGLALYRAAGAFTLIVDTEGSDIDHLLTAMEQVGNALLVRIIYVSIGIGFGVVGFVGLLVMVLGEH